MKERADRKQSVFSVVVFELAALGRKEQRRFLNNALRLVRTTDHVGWIARGRLGVVLPATDAGGAQSFARKLETDAQEAAVPNTVHTYPDAWLQPGSNPKDAEQNTNASENGNGHKAAGNDRALFALRVPTWKRALDITGSLLGLIVLSPFLLIVALYIKLVSPGPVLFRQTRYGLGKTEFEFLKFRTMHPDNDQQGHTHHLHELIHSDSPMEKLDEEDDRIIPGGRILRKVAIDELPQLLNILRGDMSLVGPRPCIPYEADEYERWHTDRFAVVPGLTGLWQVSGKNKLSFAQMIRLDIAYQRNMSFWLDLWIVLKTVPTVAGLAIEGAGRRLARLRAREVTGSEA